MLPSLDFYTGTVTTSIPASSSVLYQIPVPPEATRFKYSATHASSVTVRLEQGTLPGATGTQHLVSSGANSTLNQPLSIAVWPWQPDQTYYVRFVNSAATAQAITFTLNGKNSLTEDDDFLSACPMRGRRSITPISTATTPRATSTRTAQTIWRNGPST